MAKVGRKPAGLEKHNPTQEAFLAAYAKLGNITQAARIAKCHPSRHRNDWRKDPVYAAKFAEAYEQANDALEAEARRRATEGTKKPVFHKGKVCGHIREFSDTLLVILLKANRPGKFRENVNHTGELAVKMYGKETPIDAA